MTFTVTQGGGSLNPETTQTNPDGRARSLLTLGNSPGTNTVTVSVAGVAETVTFTAIGELPEFDLSLQAGLNLIHVPLKVSFIDGIPGTIESVSDLYDALRRQKRPSTFSSPTTLKRKSGAAISVHRTAARPLIDG